MNNRQIYISLSILIISALLCGGISCSHKVERKPTIAVSILPQKYLLERIVGDNYAVVTLLSQGSNPETFEPNSAHLLSLETSDAYFRIGNIEFELAISKRIKSNNPGLKVYDNSVGIELLEDSHNCGGHHGNEFDHGHEVDPHIWSSVKNARMIAANMLNAVVELDPKNSRKYKRNYDNLCDSLDELDAQIDSLLSPVKGRSFAVWHPSLSYFARDYGLTQIAMQSENKESSIKRFKQRFDTVASDSILVFLYQKEFDGRIVEPMAKELGVVPVAINPLNSDWKQELLNTAYAIANGKQYE